MMILKHLMFQLVPIAISFGVAYWILITASHQESMLKNIGRFLGWLLIVLAILATIFSNYYAFTMKDYHYMHRGDHMRRMMHQQEMKMMDMKRQDKAKCTVKPMDEKTMTDDKEDYYGENDDEDESDDSMIKKAPAKK